MKIKTLEYLSRKQALRLFDEKNKIERLAIRFATEIVTQKCHPELDLWQFTNSKVALEASDYLLELGVIRKSEFSDGYFEFVPTKEAGK